MGICFILSLSIKSKNKQGEEIPYERALCLPGGLSTFMSDTMIACIVGLLFHLPVVIITICLMLTSFMKPENKIFGKHRLLTVNVTTWIRILGVWGFLACILGPANLHFIRCTFLNPLWCLYLPIFIFCLIAGSGGFQISLTEDIEVSLPTPRKKRKRVVKRIRTT